MDNLRENLFLDKTSMNNFELINCKNTIINTQQITALGIGDILISLVLLKNNIIQPPIYINLDAFKDNTWYDNPSNFLDFRLKLIEYICINNDIDFNNIKLLDYNNNNNNYFNQHQEEIPKINIWNLQLNLNTFRFFFLICCTLNHTHIHAVLQIV